MRFYWVRGRIQQSYFRVFWEGGKKNLADYFTKHHPIWHHRTKQPIFLKPTKKDTENLKYRKTGTGRGFDGNINTGVTLRPDNPLKLIRNPFSRNLNNPLNGIQNIFSK